MCLNIKLIPLFMLLVMSLKNSRGHCKHEIKDEAYHHLHSVSSKQKAVFEGNSRRTYKCIFLAFYHHWIWLIFDYMSFSHVFQVLSVFLEYFSSTFCTQIFFPGLKLFSKQMYFLLLFIHTYSSVKYLFFLHFLFFHQNIEESNQRLDGLVIDFQCLKMQTTLTLWLWLWLD